MAVLMLDPINPDLIKRSSDRSFGLVFAAVALLIAFYPLVRSEPPRIWGLVLATVFGVLAWLAPGLLAPLNLIWFHFGLLLRRIINPIALAIIYCILILPVGIIMRLAGKNPLRLGREPNSASYWIGREPPGPSPDSFQRPF